MIQRTLLLFLSLTLLVSCSSSDDNKEDNIAFETYKANFLNQFWVQEPEWATQVGYHKYDSILIIPNQGSRDLYLEFLNNQLDSLKNFKLKDLNLSQQTDYHLIQNELDKKSWALTQEKAYEWNPAVYNVGNLIAFMLSENYAPLENRLNAIYHRLLKVPIYYDAAKSEIRNPVLILSALAIDQNLGSIPTFETDLVDSIKKSNLTEEDKGKLMKATGRAIAAIHGYVTYLKEYSNPNPRSFRLGKDLYDKKFEFDIQSGYTAQQLFDSAVVRKNYLHQQMFKISSELWSKYFGDKIKPADTLALIQEVIDTLSSNHVNAADFQSAIEAQIPKLVAFVKEKDLLHIDDSKPLVVRKEPAYMAGVAGASISAPGPYDADGNTYYNVGSLAGWSPEKAESYLREYNDYTLQILNIHEAIPGHYTQLVYANQSPSLIKSIFGNGAMIEGWAVYTEQMMLENGYGNNEPEMWLMWYKWNLRTVCNTILDYSVHVKEISVEDAMHLLITEAFQQNTEAEGKWKRVCVSSVQLTSYYAGYKEIYDLREAVKLKKGKDFNLRAFNEKFLSFGNAPVKYISAMMLK